MGMSLPLRLDPLEHDEVVADHLDAKTAQEKVRNRGKGRVRVANAAKEGRERRQEQGGARHARPQPGFARSRTSCCLSDRHSVLISPHAVTASLSPPPPPCVDSGSPTAFSHALYSSAAAFARAAAASACAASVDEAVALDEEAGPEEEEEGPEAGPEAGPEEEEE